MGSMDTLSLGTVPVCEDCAQVGTEGYEARARWECFLFRGQLYRQAKQWMADNHANAEFPTDDFRLRVKSNPHDFGNYLEVVCVFNPESQIAVELAFFLEGHLPEGWDEESLSQIRAAS